MYEIFDILGYAMWQMEFCITEKSKLEHVFQDIENTWFCSTHGQLSYSYLPFLILSRCVATSAHDKQ